MEEILQYIKEHADKGLKAEELADLLPMDLNELAPKLNELVADYEIVMNKKGKYFPAEHDGIFKGNLRVNKKGFGFVVIEGREKDIYVSASHMNGALNQDDVVVKYDFYDDEGKILKVLKHGVKDIIGIINKYKKSGKLYCSSDDSRIPSGIIEVSNLDEWSVVEGHKVLLEITNYQPLVAKIVDVIGHVKQPGVDVLSKLYEFDIFPEFNDMVDKEVQRLPKEVQEEELQGREDWRNVWTCTIDGDDSKDFDDAISIKRTDRGYELAVHIADVSHYVEENTAIDTEAYMRGTSVYVVDRVVPMLPFQLSNGICSLNPQVDRLTLSCIMEYSYNGTLLDYRIVESVINSNERMTYSNVNKILNDDPEVCEQYKDCLEQFYIMEELSKKIRYYREERGAIDFDTTESKFIIDDNGKVLDIKKRERGEAERIIEDFMIAANETVASHMKHCNYPSLYRVHEAPDPKRVREFMQISRNLGYPYKGSATNVHIKEYQRLLESAKGSDEYSILSTFMLRSMSKARYDVNCLGHFGLASEFYTHFTSPIRRYPDLILHRCLRKYVFNNSYDPKEMKDDILKLEDIAMQTSEKERNAIDAERSVDDMKMAEFFEDKIGNVYEGIISSVTNFGMFVELPNTVEGLVHMMNMRDDYYYYDAEHMSLVGERHNRVYKMGQHIMVKVKMASKATSTIDFEVVKRAGKAKNESKPKKDLKTNSKAKASKKQAAKSENKSKVVREKFYAKFEKKPKKKHK